MLLKLLLLALTCSASDFEPMLDARALGGQYFFRGKPASVSGNASGSAAVAARVGRWLVLPSVSSTYEGTKGALELVGGGTLFQQRMIHRVGVRGVREIAAGWRLKPFGSARYELVNETRDERWGKGLFDHRQWEIGLEAEREWREPHALRISLAYFDTRFPNYQSLATRAEALAFGLGRPKQGERVLDSRSIHGALAADAPVGEYLTLEGSLSERYTRYPEQMVVGNTGDLTDDAREDMVTRLAGAARAPLSLGADARAVFELSGALTHRGSTQNGYDVSRGEFWALTENSLELRGGLSARALFGPARRPKQVSLLLETWRTKWPHRPAQDERGVPDQGTLSQTSVRVSAGGSWPLTDRFSLVASADWLRAGSNQRYEAFYAYRYTAANYLFGFSFEY